MTSEPPCRDTPATPARKAAWPWWIATIAFFTAASLMHLQFSLWLVRRRDLPWGLQALSDLVPALSLAGGLILAVVIVRHLRRSPHRWIIAGGWLLVGAAAFAVDRFLTYSANEYFHYPQYAALAWLIARLLDPERRRWLIGPVLFWTTVLGAVDELLQYLWITTGYSHYFDFNDVFVNLIAGAAGVLLYYGPSGLPHTAQRRRPPWLEAAVAAALALFSAVTLASGQLQPSPRGDVPPGGLMRDSEGRWALFLQRKPQLHGSWQPGPHRGSYYVLTPLEGILCVVVAGTLFTALGAVRRMPVTKNGVA